MDDRINVRALRDMPMATKPELLALLAVLEALRVAKARLDELCDQAARSEFWSDTESKQSEADIAIVDQALAAFDFGEEKQE